MEYMYDFHIHSQYSDGEDSIQEIIRKSIKNSIKKIGISDHWKTRRYTSDFYVNNVEKYFNDIDKIRMNYKNDIKVYIGLEIDYTDRYGENITQKNINEFNKLDYLLFEYVDTKYETWGLLNGKSIDTLIELRKKLKCKVGLAHNNFYHNYKNNYEEILKLMGDYDIFLELCEPETVVLNKITNNSLKRIAALKKGASLNEIKYRNNKENNIKKHSMNGKYYFENFPNDIWRLIKLYNISISLGTDNHKNENIGSYDLIPQYIQKYDLYDQIIFGEKGDDLL